MYKPSDLTDERWNRHTGHSRMVGLPINPTSCFMYWEVDSDKRTMIAEHFASDWHALPLYLCLYDVTECWFDGRNAPLLERCSVSSEADNWYLRGLTPHHNYVVDLATTTIHNRLFCIQRSNVISLPPGKAMPAQPHVQFVQPPPPRAMLMPPPASSAAYRYDGIFDGYHISEPGGDGP